jgi:hypothetical protein
MVHKICVEKIETTTFEIEIEAKTKEKAIELVKECIERVGFSNIKVLELDTDIKYKIEGEEIE